LIGNICKKSNFTDAFAILHHANESNQIITKTINSLFCQFLDSLY
jgi:hypothetical protein